MNPLPPLVLFLGLLHRYRLHVGVDGGGDAAAGLAAVARGLVALAVEGLSQGQGQGMLAHALRPDEEVGVGGTAGGEGTSQGRNRPLLADEAPGTLSHR